mmetsp:Transcript_41334/g.98065  ORF Transcript_41334/g.98065 Transcript_41334/m.98065 type:complete len:179 (-) Transcript_41334:125-661(-)
MDMQSSEVTPQSPSHAAMPDYIALDSGSAKDLSAHASLAKDSAVEASRKLEETSLSPPQSSTVTGFPGGDTACAVSSASGLLPDAPQGESQSEEEFVKKWSLRLAAANRKVEEAKAEKELAERMLAMVGGGQGFPGSTSSRALDGARPFSMPLQAQQSHKGTTSPTRRNSERHRFWLF